MKRKLPILLVLLFISITFVSAQFSIDISGLNKEKYNIGEELTFKVILLDEGTQIEKQVDYKIEDALKKKEITGQTTSGQETPITIENDFLGGIWTITATYSDTKVERTFVVSEKTGIEFLIQGDELIIRNTGNVRYTKTIKITIGTESNTYAQNIKAGEEKILKLISANGAYNIEVTDGDTTIKKENVRLFGTGNVVGAVDKELVGYTGFAVVDDPEDIGNRPLSLSKLPLTLIFVGAVVIIAALIFIERKLTKKKSK